MSDEEDARVLRRAWAIYLGLEHLDIDRADLARRLRAAARTATFNPKLLDDAAGVTLTRGELKFLADLAEGKKRPKHRPASLEAAIKRDVIAGHYIYLNTAFPGQEGKNKTLVADEFEVSETSVTKAMQSLEPERRKELENRSRSVAGFLLTKDFRSPLGSHLKPEQSIEKAKVPFNRKPK